MSLLGGLSNIKNKISEKLLSGNDKKLDNTVSQSQYSKEESGCKVMVDACAPDYICDIFRPGRADCINLARIIEYGPIIITEGYTVSEYQPFMKVHGSKTDHIVTKEEYDANKLGE